MTKRYLPQSGLALALLLGACGPGDDDGVGGVTTSEARALNDAAEMLDARPRADLGPQNATTAPPPVDGDARPARHPALR